MTPAPAPAARGIVRTPREWDETCPACRGAGQVHRKEHFVLMTSDEYANFGGSRELPLKLDPKHDVPADAYVCVVLGSGFIGDAVKEAMFIAQRVNRPVAFEFNDAAVVVRSDSDPDKVVKDWWKRAYGRTYEESMGER